MRAAKKEIAEKVREDWTWPLTSPHMQPCLDETGDSIEWRQRDSDSEYSLPSPVTDADPYRFDNPDSIAQNTVSRKRKRQQRLEEEMEWNEGMRTFVERRDAWAGARKQPSSAQTQSQEIQTPSTTTEVTMNNTPLPPTPQSPTNPPPTHHQAPNPPTLPTLLPLAPPILPPTNPIRASIRPDTYPSIYTKIIIGGQSPTIPINLSDVVNALVAGWKKDGEWPPKSEAVVGQGVVVGGDVSARREAQRLARKGVGRVRRVLGLGRGEGGGEV